MIKAGKQNNLIPPYPYYRSIPNQKIRSSHLAGLAGSLGRPPAHTRTNICTRHLRMDFSMARLLAHRTTAGSERRERGLRRDFSTARLSPFSRLDCWTDGWEHQVSVPRRKEERNGRASLLFSFPVLVGGQGVKWVKREGRIVWLRGKKKNQRPRYQEQRAKRSLKLEVEVLIDIESRR